MARITIGDLAALIEDMRTQLAALAERVAVLEPKAAPAAPAARVEEPPPPQISEEELTAISAALAAYLGVRAHIRQIRLLSSSRWAQEGRVSIQASHRLHG